MCAYISGSACQAFRKWQIYSHLQSWLFLVSWKPGLHSHAMPPFGASLQIWAQPWFLSIHVGPSFVPFIRTADTKRNTWNGHVMMFFFLLFWICKIKICKKWWIRLHLLRTNTVIRSIQIPKVILIIDCSFKYWNVKLNMQQSFTNYPLVQALNYTKHMNSDHMSGETHSVRL